MAPRWARDRSRWPRTRSKIAKILQDSSKKLNTRVFRLSCVAVLRPVRHQTPSGEPKRSQHSSKRPQDGPNMAPKWLHYALRSDRIDKKYQNSAKKLKTRILPRYFAPSPLKKPALTEPTCPQMAKRWPRKAPTWLQDAIRRGKIAKILQDISKKLHEAQHIHFPYGFCSF